MFTYNRIRGFVALAVLLAIVLTTTPISAADFSTPKAVIGSVSGVGSVQLRGVSISQEGTLFRGDQVSVGAKGYAKVTLTNGHKLELDSLTKLTVVGSGQTAQLQVTSGNMAFTTKSGTLDIAAGNFEITGDHNVTGNVAFVGNGFVGLRVKTGTAMVRNLSTKETVKVTAGQERLFGVSTDGKTPLVQLASLALPDPIPAAPPAPQAPKPASSSGMNKSGWITILATIGGATAGIVVLSRSGGATTDTAGTLHQQQSLGAANQAALTASTAATAAASAATAAASASAAIAAAPLSANLSASAQASFVSQANSLAASATATQQQIVTLQAQLSALQTQLASVTDSGTVTTITAQINTVINSLNTDTAQLNSTIAALNALLAAAKAAGVANVPTFTVAPIPPVPTASASIPV